jgi:hypothetical protein
MPRLGDEAGERAVGRFVAHDPEGLHLDAPQGLVVVAARIAHDV